MRRVLALLFVPLLCLGGIATFAAAPAMATPAATCAYGPCGGTGTISITIHIGPDGIVTITINGSGFKPGEIVDFTVHSASYSVGSTVASSSGTISSSVTLPAGIPAGNHELIALGTVSGVTSTTPFTLSAPTGGLNPCTTSASTHSSGFVLAAAYQTTACLSQNTPAAANPSAVGNPSAGANPAAASQGSSQLPFTGANAATGVAIAAMALLAGGLLVLVSRRRRRSA